MTKSKSSGSGKRPTITDVARRAGVSIGTVSLAINGTGPVGDDARSRILAAVEELGYRGNQSARSMRTGRSQTVGLVLPDLTNPFFPQLAQAFEEAAGEAGYAVLLVDSRNGEAERQGLERLDRHHVDGICWCPTSEHDVASEIGLTIPIALIDRPLPGYDVVLSDHRTGGDLLARHVIDVGFGTIGLLTGPDDLPGAKQRRGSFKDALGGSATICWEVPTPYSLELSPEAIAHLSRFDVDAVLCPNDVVAIAVIHFFDDNARAVPGDVAVLGFDDIPWATIVKPHLTTVRQPIGDLGREVFALLMRRIDMPDAVRRTISLDVTFVERGSTRV